MTLDLPRLAQRPEDDAFIRPLVQEAFDALMERLPPGSFHAVMLTGAMTRGEGSVLTRLDGSRALLSDIDFLIITATPKWHRQLRVALPELAKQMNEHLRPKGLTSHVDYLTAMETETRAWPSMISNNEIIASAVTLAGEGPVSRWFGDHVRPETIEQSDSLAMIHTRMMGHLLYRWIWSPDWIHEETNIFDFRLYHCAKIATDLAAIVLSFRGGFACSCQERLIRMRKFMTSEEGQVLADRCPRLMPLVERWTAFKLQPDLRTLVDAEERQLAAEPLQHLITDLWEEVRVALRTLWRWELSELHGVPESAPVWEAARAIAGPVALGRATKLWAKTRFHPNAIPGFMSPSKTLRGLATRRDPLSLTFAACACLLFDESFPCSDEAFAEARRFSPLTAPCNRDREGMEMMLTRLWLLLVKGGAD